MMFHRITCLSTFAALLVTSAFSCGPETAAPAPKAEGSSHPMQSMASPAAQHPITASAAPVDAPPAPPKDAQFTIYCTDFAGPAHVDESNQMKAELNKNSGMRGWYVVHQEDRSTLFFGYYHDTKEPAVTLDRKRIEAITDRLGNKLFRSAYALPIDAPDPVAPAEWNLSNVRNGDGDVTHCWTLQIAAYRDSPERKKAAVDAVREARAQGVQAYYFHGPTISSVCVGCWPKDAIQQEGEVTEMRSDNAGKSVIVMPGNIDPNIERKIKGAADRDDTSVSKATFQILDPTLQAAMDKYKYHYVNGEVEGVRSNGVLTPKRSTIVEIPASAAAAGMGNMSPVAPTPEAARVLSPGNSQPAGSGRLKSLGQ